MLKIITKSAHNALLYQIEDLKKKLADGLKINDEIFNDLIAKNDTIRKQNHKINELQNAFDLISKESETNRTQLTRCSQRHKSAALRNEKLQKANTSLLSKNESLTAENHRLGNLLQVKCDEVKTLERNVQTLERKFKEPETRSPHKELIEAIGSKVLKAKEEMTIKHRFNKSSVQEHFQLILNMIESNI